MIKSYFKKNTKIILLLSLFLFISSYSLSAADNLTERLSGKILLQVESHGEAWYVNQSDLKKYYLGRPSDAFSIMKFLGQGITNNNLNKINIGLIDNLDGLDTDQDGLADNLENALGTDKNKKDTDNDGYDDKTEIENNYNPNGGGAVVIDNNFLKNNLGKIFLQTEARGEAWYINPADGKRYFLGRPLDAFNIMKKFGLGITNNNLNKIVTGFIAVSQPDDIKKDPPITDGGGGDIIYSAATAIRAKDKILTASYFIPEMKKSIEYNLDNMSDESILALGNILSGSKLTSSTATEKIYTNDVYFSLGGYNVLLKFYIKKQPDGKWLMTNL